MDPGVGTCPNPSGAAASLFVAGISALSLLQCDIADPSIYPNDTVPGTEYDFIVVGAGSAGSVVANRLSVVPHWNILLLEAGGDPPYTSEVPALSTTLQNTEVDWKFRTDGTGNYCLGMVDKKCSWPRGKVLGGTSVLSTMSYLRGHPHDYETWASMGNKHWAYKYLIPYFEKAEGIERDGDVGHLNLEEFHGGESTGELPLLKPLKRAAIKIGKRATLNAKFISYPGYFNTFGTIINGTRHSAAKAYLAPIKHRTNLHVAKHAFVTKIIFNEERRAIGVEYEKDGITKTVMSRKEVILSAGTIGSPQILMLSGVGPKKHLTKLGITILANLPVGNNLQDHLIFPGVVASINRGASSLEDPTKELARSISEYLLDRKGRFSGVGYLQFTGFVAPKNHKDSAYPKIQILPVLFNKGDNASLFISASAFGYDESVSSQYLSLLSEADLFLVVPSVIHPKSRGRLRLVSTNPHDHPKITPNYFEDPDDEDTMLGGIEEAMRILKAMSSKQAVRVEPRVLLKECLEKGKRAGRGSKRKDIDDSSVMTKSYWRCAMRKLSSTDYHHVGTCRMGPHSDESVVDPRLRVHSVKGLRVIDASIMPTITSGNIYGAVIAIAEKGASIILKEHKR